MRVLFVEPPVDFWFLMGKYIPPPFGLLTLAAHLERSDKDASIEVLDCQAEGVGWDGLEARIRASRPDIVAPSGLATCNAYAALRTAEIAKSIDPSVVTVAGGQHFTALARETLEGFPCVDFVVRGEGDMTFTELVSALADGEDRLASVRGISYRKGGRVVSNRDRPLIESMDSLPFPGYSHVRQHMGKYYFALMAEEGTPFAIIEGSRGCTFDCSYCSQWGFWHRQRRAKSPARIADEFQRLHEEFGSRFFWLTDDNLGIGRETEALCDELIARGMGDRVTWFIQARCDDIVRSRGILPKLRKAGCVWMLVGMDSPDQAALDGFRRGGVTREIAKESVDLLRENNIFCQGTFIIGARKDTRQSIKAVLDYAHWLDPDIATFMALTPFPGTVIYEEARRNGWIESTNWSDYDMVHAVMPTETLTREEVQEELVGCYRAFFGSWKRRYQGVYSKNPITKRTYLYLAKQALLGGLKSLLPRRSP
jgi:anaerobic magnesium-protoporphyrin IX monomethyl ester cyclase